VEEQRLMYIKITCCWCDAYLGSERLCLVNSTKDCNFSIIHTLKLTLLIQEFWYVTNHS